MRRTPLYTLPMLISLIMGVAVFSLAVDLQGAVPNVPNWQLRCSGGESLDFHEELAQRPVLISFWALWCKPCLKELPHLDKLAQEYGDQLKVLAVNIDSQRSVAKVRPFLKSKGYKLTVPMDTAGDLRRQMQVGDQVPFLILYDTSGQEVYRHVGYKEGDEISLRREIAAFLDAAPGGEE